MVGVGVGWGEVGGEGGVGGGGRIGGRGLEGGDGEGGDFRKFEEKPKWGAVLERIR